MKNVIKIIIYLTLMIAAVAIGMSSQRIIRYTEIYIIVALIVLIILNFDIIVHSIKNKKFYLVSLIWPFFLNLNNIQTIFPETGIIEWCLYACIIILEIVAFGFGSRLDLDSKFEF